MDLLVMIARETGYPFLGDLARRLTLPELEAWSRHFAEYGFTPVSSDLRHAMLCAMVAASAGSKSAHAEDFFTLPILRKGETYSLIDEEGNPNIEQLQGLANIFAAMMDSK